MAVLRRVNIGVDGGIKLCFNLIEALYPRDVSGVTVRVGAAGMFATWTCFFFAQIFRIVQSRKCVDPSLRSG